MQSMRGQTYTMLLVCGGPDALPVGAGQGIGRAWAHALAEAGAAVAGRFVEAG